MDGAARLLGSSPTQPARGTQFWLIVRDGVNRLEPLTAEFADGRSVLCVFSYEEEAGLFLRLCACRGWRVRATGIGDLVSILSGPCRKVELVALDPFPRGQAGALNDLLCVDRDRFAAFLLQKGSGH